MAVTQAGALIAAEIAARGPITFQRFMELALFHPEVGYYARSNAGPGAEADYLTSPEIHSGFAVLLCRQFFEMWRHLGEPQSFWLVEVGPGSGGFMADVLATATAVFPDFADALQIALIEPSPTLTQQQAARMRTYGDRVRWLSASPPWPTLGAGCVYGNEVLDALPVHRVVMHEAGLKERWVGWNAEFFDVLRSPTTPALAKQIAEGGGVLATGQAGEVNLAAPPLVESLASLVDPGYLMLLDYGEPAVMLYGDRHPDGTLRCYWRHTRNRDPYRLVGEQDITSHVDLTAVTHAGEAAGLTLLGATRQARLLQRLGIESVLEAMSRSSTGRPDMRADRAALSLLVDPRHLGRLAALVFGRNCGEGLLTGFSDQVIQPLDVPGQLLQVRSDPAQVARSTTRRAWEVDEMTP